MVAFCFTIIVSCSKEELVGCKRIIWYLTFVFKDFEFYYFTNLTLQLDMDFVQCDIKNLTLSGNSLNWSSQSMHDYKNY